MAEGFIHAAGDEAALRIIVKQQRKEIDQLKEAIRKLADHDATITFIDGDVLVTMDATLTDAERASIEIVADWAEDHLGEDDPGVIALRSMLERTK